MESILDANGISVYDLLRFAPWLSLYLSIITFIVGLVKAKPDPDDVYEPQPGTKWLWQANPELRSNEEHLPNALMQAELALYRAYAGPWPSWYIGWNFELQTWDWAKGWRRDGLPAASRRGPVDIEDRWYWHDDVDKRMPDEPLPTNEMTAQALQYTSGKAAWPSWYLSAEEAAEALPGELSMPYDPEEAPPAPRKELLWGKEWTPEAQPYVWGDAPLNPPLPPEGPTDATTAWRTVCSFLAVYFLVSLADWIQGPYVYAVYKELDVPEDKIQMLFGADAISALVTGRFTGQFTDRLGRKRACQMFCFAYFVFSLTMVIPNCLGGSLSMAVLIIGRLFRGVAVNLLYSAFDSWFISTYKSLQLRKLGYVIGRVFGYLTVIKATSAFLAGLLSEQIVELTGYKEYTMIFSAGLFALAWLVIQFTWGENFGIATSIASIANAWRRPNLAPLHLVSVVFQVSLDLFTLLWARTLEDASPKMQLLPYPIIYTTFLGFTALGALIFNTFVTSKKYISYNNALAAAFLAGAVSLAVPFFARSNLFVTFVVLCFFRMCMGIISPVMCQLLYTIVPDSSRAEIYTIFHLPFFQWSHWLDYLLIFFFGPRPDDVAEKVFLYLAVALAASGVFWYFVSNYDDLDLPHSSDEDLALRPVVPRPTFKQKLWRIRTLVDFWKTTAIVSLWAISDKIFMSLLPGLGQHLFNAIASGILTVVHAFKYVGHLALWMVPGSTHPRPLPLWDDLPGPSNQGGGIFVAVGTAGQPVATGSAAEFAKFWKALGKLVQGVIITGTLLLTLFTVLFLLCLTSDTFLGTDLAEFWVDNAVNIWKLVVSLFEKFCGFAKYMISGSWLGLTKGIKSLYEFSLEFFTTCTLMLFKAIKWAIASSWSLWHGTSNAALLLVSSCLKIFDSIVVKPVKWLVKRRFNNTYVDEISETISNASLSIRETVTEAATDSRSWATDVSNTTFKYVTNLTDHLIPGGWENNAVVYITDGIGEIIAAGSEILLKRPGYQDILHDNWVILAVSIVTVPIIIYLIPWGYLYDSAEKLLQKVWQGLRWAYSLIIRLGDWVSAKAKTTWLGVYGFIAASISDAYGWVERHAGPIYLALPSPLQTIMDPFRFIASGSWLLLRWALAILIGILARAMIKIGDFVHHVGNWIGPTIEKLARFGADKAKNYWTVLSAMLKKTLDLWMRAAHNLKDYGVYVGHPRRPPPPPPPPSP